MKVFITRVISSLGLDLLQKEGFIITQWKEKRNLTPDELIQFCQDNDVLLSAGSNLLTADFFKACSHLKAVSLHSAGYDRVDIAAADYYNIPVGHTPGVLSKATANIALLLMLAVSRNAFYWHHKILKGDWGFFEPMADLGVELEGKTLGVYGMGQIGMELGRKCRAAFGMKLLYHNRKRNLAVEQELGADYVSFPELLAQSDVLSVHTNLTNETRGVFNQTVFAQMKPTAIFINTARGEIHQEDDLKEALEKGVIWGAGLDVTNPEPMSKQNKLLTLPNVCILPHIGSATIETRNAMSVLAARNLIAIKRGEKMPYCVNP